MAPKELSPDPGIAFTEGSERSGKEWVTELIALTKQIAAIAGLNLTVSNPPTQAEGQAIADKINLNDVRLNQCGYGVPEPSSGAMLFAGLGVLGLIGASRPR